MTPAEATQFFESAFIAFPGLAAWLRETSTDGAATCSVWARTLSKISFDEATYVLDGWIDGTIKDPPVGYRRESFALHVKAIALTERDKLNKEIDRENQWIKNNRGYQRAPVLQAILGPGYQRQLEWKPKLEMGEVTHEQYDARCDAIANEVFA
jgi:hypothetical protein